MTQSDNTAEAERKFILQHLLLIHKKTGLLLKHVSNVPGWEKKEEDTKVELVSGMLTAIKKFTEKVLNGGNEKGDLLEIVHSDYIIKIDTGDHSMLAAIIKHKDKAPDDFYDQLKNIHNNIVNTHSSEFEKFDGSQELSDDLSNELSSFLKLYK